MTTVEFDIDSSHESDVRANIEQALSLEKSIRDGLKNKSEVLLQVERDLDKKAENFGRGTVEYVQFCFRIYMEKVLNLKDPEKPTRSLERTGQSQRFGSHASNRHRR